MNPRKANAIANVGAATVLIGILWVGLDAAQHTSIGNWVGIVVLSFGLLLTAIGISQADDDFRDRVAEDDPDDDDEYRFDGGDGE